MGQERMAWSGKASESAFCAAVCTRGIHKFLFLHGHSMERLPLGTQLREALASCQVPAVECTAFQPNPVIDDVRGALRIYQEEACDAILAVGGGSAIDVAKCVKRYAACDPASDLLRMSLEANTIPLFAAPTTAGTGSEATHFAVVYEDGKKYSVADASLVPDVAIFDPTTLVHLPLYQKKATALDAFCHAVEACWSAHATAESQADSVEALKLFCAHIDAYLQEEPKIATCRAMMQAAYHAGSAINVAKTTAGHAMCYGLTGRYGLAHGHAAALCVARLWPRLIRAASGRPMLARALQQITEAMGDAQWTDSVRRLQSWLKAWALSAPLEEAHPEAAAETLAGTVNQQRLGNHPAPLPQEEIRVAYQEILSGTFQEV